MPKRQTPLTLIFVAVGLLLIAVPGLWVYMTTTAPLHPNPQDVPSSVPAANSSAELGSAAAHARQLLRDGLLTQNLPGLSAAVGVDGEIVWAESVGYADLDNRVPLTPNHRFRIGTASTVLTSAAAGLLIEQGKLKLDERIQTYVPEVPWPVTLRQVMAHTAGIRNDGGDEGPLFAEHCDRPAQALPHFVGKPLLFEPGTQYRYSRYGWILVSAAIEAAANQPFHTFLSDQVFTPLAMRSTTPDSPAAPDRVTPYFPRLAANPRYGLHPMRDLDLSCYAGSSAFLSTPSDLVRFGMAVESGKLLKPATTRLLQASERLPTGEDTGYGLGWDIERISLHGAQTRVVGHDGDLLGGYVATLLTVPNRGLVIAVLSNISYADTFGLAAKLAEAFTPTTAAPPGPSRPSSRTPDAAPPPPRP